MHPLASSRKCTCLVDTESDSEDDSVVASSGPIPSATSISARSTDATPTPAEAHKPTDLTRKVSGYRDAISTSTALHNSEALRQAHVLQNVFCACYDVETVVSQVQRRERTFSPVQLTLLKQENVATVFRYATTLPERTSSTVGVGGSTTAAPSPDRYRRSIVATEIILKFYLKAMAWQGSPKPRSVPSPRNNGGSATGGDRSPTGAVSPPMMFSPPSSPNQPRRRFSVDASGVVSPTHTRQILSFGSTYKSKAAAHKRHNPFSNSYSLHDVTNGVHANNMDAVDSPEVRGYLLRLEDLTEVEWKAIFTQLYRFLWENAETIRMELSEGSSLVKMQAIAESGTANDDDVVDSVLVANMCRITKHFIVFPSVHKLLASIECPGPQVEGAASSTTLFPALAAFAYSTDVATLLHGVMHIALRRQFDLDGIAQSIVYQIVSILPAGAARFNGTSANGAQVFSIKKPRYVHETVSGCADILAKILMQQFPNTFRYYIHTKVQLASFESVEAYERELFPPKVPPSDPSLHSDIKNAVMTALMDNSDTLMKLAEISLAEIRFLDAYHSSVVGVPPTLVVDVIRCAIECSLADRPQLELFLPCVYRLIDTFCAAINFHQHMTTITEFASRDCFSDSDSDDASGGLDEDDEDGSDGDMDPTNRRSRKSFPDAKLFYSQSLQFDDEDGRSTKDSFASTSSSSLCFSPSSGRLLVNHRPLTSILLILSIVEFLDTVIRMGIDTIDNRLVRLDLSTSLLDLFEKYPKANVLHCRLVKLYLSLVDRTTTGRVNNPFLRSVFRPPNSLQEFIMLKLHQSPKTHPYDPHISILGVKIDKICSSPTLQQELIRQYTTSTPGWSEFASSLVARHYQQMDALDALALTAGVNGGNGAVARRSVDGIDEVFPLNRASSSSCEFLTDELQPFRRLPMEKEGFGSSQNLAMGTDAVLPTDMLKSRAQSQYPESIIEILRNDTTTSFDATEDERIIVGFAYQKRAKWVKVQIKFDKATCMLVVQDASKMSASSSGSTNTTNGTTGPGAAGMSSPSAPSGQKKATSISTSKLKQLWIQHKPQWATPRPRKFVVCTARKWIAFGRTVKNPNVGAFGFQIDVFDRIREEDKTLTFVTRSEQTRTQWFDALQNAVAEARVLRHQSFTEVDEEANIMLVKCVATQREGTQMVYLALPDVHVLSPVICSSFSLKSEVPEDIPFWGTFQGPHGVSKYCSLFKSCLHVVSVQEKRVYASGYSVVVEFDATVQAVESAAPATPVPQKPLKAGSGRLHLQLQLAPPPDPEKTVTCSFTDTYLVSGNQIISMTRTIADSEKLVQILCDDSAE